MADYQKMYAVLCMAIDGVLDDLESIPLARPYAQKLYSALLMVEDIYVDTAPYAAEVENKKVIQLKIDRYPEE